MYWQHWQNDGTIWVRYQTPKPGVRDNGMLPALRQYCEHVGACVQDGVDVRGSYRETIRDLMLAGF